jgi:hydroxyacylglutathione hydrolase
MNQASKSMEIIQILVGQMANFTYIIADKNSLDAAVIDPSWDLETVISVLKKNKWNARYIINTHTHYDHIIGNEQVATATGAEIMQHENSKAYKDITLTEGQFFTIGNIMVNVLFTPGHSNDSICLIVDENLILTGDTLFIGSCGRTDLPGSNAGFMYDSLYCKIMNLKDSLIVYPGHDYGPTKTSTIYKEKRSNPMLNFRSKDSFLRYITGGL